MKKIFVLILFLVIGQLIYAQKITPSIGAIKSYVNFPSKYVEPRNIDVWLPDKYDAKQKYAVLYMQDGQMLFDSTTNWIHQEWRVDETINKLIKENKIRNCIVVGIWNSGLHRHAE